MIRLTTEKKEKKQMGGLHQPILATYLPTHIPTHLLSDERMPLIGCFIVQIVSDWMMVNENWFIQSGCELAIVEVDSLNSHRSIKC